MHKALPPQEVLISKTKDFPFSFAQSVSGGGKPVAVISWEIVGQFRKKGGGSVT